MRYFANVFENELRVVFCLILFGISFQTLGPKNSTKFSSDTSLESDTEY